MEVHVIMTGFSSKLSTEISGIGWAPVGLRDLFIAYGKTIQPCSKTSVERAFGSFVGAILGRMASVPRGELAAIHQANPERRSLTLGFSRNEGQVTPVCECPEELRAAVKAHTGCRLMDLCSLKDVGAAAKPALAQRVERCQHFILPDYITPCPWPISFCQLHRLSPFLRIFAGCFGVVFCHFPACFRRTANLFPPCFPLVSGLFARCFRR
jgi:hypothetical protein